MSSNIYFLWKSSFVAISFPTFTTEKINPMTIKITPRTIWELTIMEQWYKHSDDFVHYFMNLK